MKFLCTLLILLAPYANMAYGALAGGRPNAFSGGQNAFAGVVNPANAVWIEDRLDVGVYWVHQKSSLNNRDDNPLFPPGKIDFTYKTKDLLTADMAIHKQIQLHIRSKVYESSLSLAAYSMPTFTKLRTKTPIPLSGTTPILIESRIDVLSAVFSFKLNTDHSVGFSMDYYYFSRERNGYENSDNPKRSVSPGNVTNNGMDHSHGIGCSVGWRWNITNRLSFGAAWAKKGYCGQYKKYRGFEPHHGENYIPQTVGAGFSYRLTNKLAGRLEVLWSNQGNLPGANNNILPDGSLNLNKRGSSSSPGPGLQDATYINLGIGYQLNSMLSLGAGFSHRIKLPAKSPLIFSHSYRLQTVYDILSLGADFNYLKHNVFLVFSYGFRNSVSGLMPIEIGGGQFTGEKQNISLSLSWGYLY